MSHEAEKRYLSSIGATLKVGVTSDIADVTLVAATLGACGACLTIVAILMAFVVWLAAFGPHDDSAVSLLPFSLESLGLRQLLNENANMEMAKTIVQ